MFFMVLVLLVAVKRERVDVLFYSYLTLMLLLCYSYVTLIGNGIYNGFITDLKRR